MSCIANRLKAVRSACHFLLMTMLALLVQLPASGQQSVALSWNPSSDAGVAGYRIYYGGASGTYTNVLDAGSATSITVSGLVAGSTNYFSATEYDAGTNESSYSSEVVYVAPIGAHNSIITNLPPNNPPVLNTVSNLVVAANPTNANSAILSWNASTDSGVAGYRIYYGASLNYTNFVDAGPATNVTIYGLASGSTNYFSATEYDGSTNESDYSSEVSYVVPVPAPVLNVVANVAVTGNPTNNTKVTLSWTPSTDAGVVGYQIFRGTASGNFSSTLNVGLISSLVVTGLVAGTTNFFSVREFNAAWNESDMSPEVRWLVPFPVNAAPTLNAIADVPNLNVNTSQTISLSGITSGSSSEKQTLKITVVSSNPTLIPTPKVTYTSPNTTGSLTYKPGYNLTGTATITVTVNDGGANNNTISRSFNVTVVNQALLAALPKITKQVTNTTTLAGKSVSLSVAVTGKTPFKYQWKFNGTNLPGATSSSLTLSSAKAANSGAYSVQVSNSAGVTNSIQALVTVVTNPAPTIVTPVLGNGKFSFQITGVPGLKYVVTASTDFKKWTPVQTNTAPFTFTQTNAASYAQRYYRSYYLP